MIRRRVFAVLSVLSLLIFVAVCAVWLRSYLPESIWFRCVDGRIVVVGSDAGYLGAKLGKDWLDAPPAGNGDVREFLELLRTNEAPLTKFTSDAPAPPPPERVGLLGIEFVTARAERNAEPIYRVLVVPAGCLALLSGILPAYCLFTLLRRRRWARSGRCGSCGYDLRASQDRCPECGTPRPLEVTA